MFFSPYERQRTEKALGDGHNSVVQMRDDKSLYLLSWVTTRGTKLASAAGCAALMAWMPLLLGASRTTLPVSQIEDTQPSTTIDAGTEPLRGLARRIEKCPECGSIEAIRKTQRGPKAVASAGREITIRLRDGSSRVMIDANPGTFRLGEQVKIIDGLAGPGE